MPATSHLRCLRLLALCLLVLCAPVLDAADCCCRQPATPATTAISPASPACCSPKPAAAAMMGSCCQTKSVPSGHTAESCRIPPARTCECCLTAAPLVFAQRLIPHPSACNPPDTAVGPTALGTPQTAVADYPQEWTPRTGNRRQAVLCCWRN